MLSIAFSSSRSIIRQILSTGIETPRSLSSRLAAPRLPSGLAMRAVAMCRSVSRAVRFLLVGSSSSKPSWR